MLYSVAIYVAVKKSELVSLLDLFAYLHYSKVSEFCSQEAQVLLHLLFRFCSGFVVALGTGLEHTSLIQLHHEVRL